MRNLYFDEVNFLFLEINNKRVRAVKNCLGIHFEEKIDPMVVWPGGEFHLPQANPKVEIVVNEKVFAYKFASTFAHSISKWSILKFNFLWIIMMRYRIMWCHKMDMKINCYRQLSFSISMKQFHLFWWRFMKKSHFLSLLT